MTQNIRADIKILVIGSSGIGKTSFVQRWTKGQFNETHRPTIVSEFGFKIFEYKEKKYRIQLWDIGGQDKTPSMAKIFSRDSHGCVVFSDCTKPETLQETSEWKKLISDESTFVDGKKLPFVLVQNKIDLIKDNMELEEAENQAKNWSEKNEFINYFMTSVKENVRVDDVMNFLLGNIVDRLEEFVANGGEFFADQRRKSTIKLREAPSFKEKKNSCC